MVVAQQLPVSTSSAATQAPSPLQERFTNRLRALSEDEKKDILKTLGLIVEMMDGTAIEAAPVLSTSPAVQSTEEVRDVLAAGEPDVALVAALAPVTLAPARDAATPEPGGPGEGDNDE